MNTRIPSIPSLHLQVTLAVPGMRPDDISVTLDRGILRIQGHREGELDGWNYNNTVERAVQLPQGTIDTEGVTATHDHGTMLGLPNKPINGGA